MSRKRAPHSRLPATALGWIDVRDLLSHTAEVIAWSESLMATLSILKDGPAAKIRLHGIDCPKKGQPFTNRAKQFVSDLAFDKEVKVEVNGQDRYGRTIGRVFLPDGRNLNHEIVRAGLAWWFRRYAPKGS